jgi:hypothetical protein
LLKFGFRSRAAGRGQRRHGAWAQKSEHLSIANFLRIRKSWNAISVALSRKEEAEDLVEPARPGILIVLPALNSPVTEVEAVAPTALDEAAMEKVGVAEVAQAFGSAHVKPDA